MHPPLTNLSAHWHKCSGEIPPPLVGASVTLVDSPTDVSSPGKLYLFGGRLVSTRRMVNDLWELDLGTMTWKRKSSPSSTSTSSKSQPQPRYFHSSDLWEGKLIIFGGMGYATPSHSSSNSATSKVDELCVLDEIIAYDLETEKWDLAFAARPSHQDSNGSSSSSTSNFAPVPRYAHLSSMTSSLLTIIGGQDMANQYVESVSVFDLKQRKWIAQKDFGKQCGSYRSLAVAGRWGVREGKGENWSTLASNAGHRSSDKKGKGREESNGLNALDANRLRAGSTASNVSNLTGISSNEIASPNSYTTSSSTGLAAPSLTSTSRRPSEMSTSTSTSSTSTEYKDATLSHSMFGTNGSAQPTSTTQPNTPTSAKSKPHQQSPSLREISPLPSSYEPSETDPLPIYVYSNFNFTNVNRQLGMVDLKRGGQTSRKSKAKGKGKAKEVEGNGAAEQDQEDEEEEVLESNPNNPLGPPEITISDKSSQMDGAALPPGLRFPTGSILGSYLLISGTYLANTSQTFSIWALHLPTLTWSRLEPGSTLSSGSWNRAVLWPTKNRLLILGHRDRSLVEDYNHRQTNWDHVVLVELEAWGIYQPPVQRFDDEAVELGLEKLASSSQGSLLAEISGDSLGSSTSIPTNPQKQPESPYANDLTIPDSLASMPASANALSLPLAPLALGGRGDMEILCSDGMKIGCDREILRNRWKWFRENDDKYQRKVKREMRKLLKQSNLANANPENPGGEDASSSSILSPSSPVGAVAGRKRGSTMSDAIRALLEVGSDDSEDEENPNNSKSTIENKENQQGSGFDATRRPSTMSIQSQSTVLSERSVSSYRPFRTPTTGFSSGLSPITPSHQVNSQDHTSSPVTSHDPRFLPRQLILNEPSPIVLAFLQYLYSQTLCTPLQRHPATIAALLVLAAAYDMPDLGAWARHAAHVSLTRDLSPEPSSASTTNPGTPTSTEPTHSINNTSPPTLGLNLEQKHRLAVVLTESAALCGCEPLQIRALRSSMVSSKWLQRSIQDAGRSRSGTTTSYGTERSYNESGSSSIFGKNDASSAIGSNRETPTPTAHGSVDARSRSNSTMNSPGGSTSGHVRRFSLTAGGQATSRAQPPSNAPPPAPAIREAYNGSSIQSTGNADLEPGESGTDDSDSSLPPLNPSRKASTGLSKAERMLGITGAEAQAAGLPGNHNSATLGSESRNPSQRRPSAGASTAGSMLSVRSGNSGGGGGRKRFSIFGRSSNSSSTLPTVNTNSTTTSNSTNKSSGDKSPVSRSSGNFDEDGNKRRSSELNTNQGLVGGIHANVPSRSTSSYLNSSTSSGTLASHLDPSIVNLEASKSSNSLNPDLQDPTSTASTMGSKSLKSRPSNSSSVVSENVYLQNRQPSSGQLDSRELSSLRALGTL